MDLDAQRMHAAPVDVEALFRVCFPGEGFSEDQKYRLAAELRRAADALQPVNDPGEAQDLAHGRNAGANGATTAPPSNRHAPKRQRRRKGRPFDFSAYHVRYVALNIMYLGWDHHGFAAQADNENTIEGHLFAALRHVRMVPEDADWHALRYSRCGRTDKGVSALGQTVALLLRSRAKTSQPLPAWQQEHDFPSLLNHVLPDTIRVLGWADVPQDFHARFGARSREYKYFLVQDAGRRLDVAAMQQAAEHLLGEHDFRNFCKMDVEHVNSFRRTILHARVEACPGYGMAGRDVCLLHLRGTAFLWHQVRCIAAVLLMVGRGEEAPAIVAQLLDVDTMPAKPYYNMAPEEPLLLAAAAYPQDIGFHRSPGVQASLRALVRSMLDRQIVAASMLATIEERIHADGSADTAQSASTDAAAAQKGVQHVLLLQRHTEPSMLQRLEKLGRTALGWQMNPDAG